MKIRMKILEDTIFGNGQSIPGEEDISVQHDENGFPYYKGSTFKGIFREELERLLKLEGNGDPGKTADELLGRSGSDDVLGERRIMFSDFVVDEGIKKAVMAEIKDAGAILDAFTSLRTFTRLDKDGIVDPGSLRIARCVNKGISLYGNIECGSGDEELVEKVLRMMKWVGTMRNRGFGRISLEKA